MDGTMLLKEALRNYEGFLRWKNKLLTVHTPKVDNLYKYKSQMDSIMKLKNINIQLDEERNLLMHLVNTYNPNAKRGQVLWQSDWDKTMRYSSYYLSSKEKIDTISINIQRRCIGAYG